MNHRIHDLFSMPRREGRTGLAVYLVAGDPDANTTLEAMERLVESGVSMIEIGMPFSDPVADGPVVAAAHRRALAGGQTTRGVFELVSRFRERNLSTPVVLMGYVNPALNLGMEAFFAEAAQAGADGAIFVDLPLEHAAPWEVAAARNGMDLVPLWAPTAPPERERRILSARPGFVYMVSRTGITGGASLDLDPVRERAGRAHSEHGVAVAAGFGIHDAAQARALAGSVDMVVVGSRCVETLAEGGIPALGRLAVDLVEAIDGAVKE